MRSRPPFRYRRRHARGGDHLDHLAGHFGQHADHPALRALERSLTSTKEPELRERLIAAIAKMKAGQK
jgi:hypothetical protein